MMKLFGIRVLIALNLSMSTNKLFHSIANEFKKSALRFFSRKPVNPESKVLYDKDGVYHDSDYVSQCIRNSDRNFRSNIDNLNRDLLRGPEMKTAVYLAAGIDSTENIINRYSSIKGINNLILIDYRTEEYECITINETFKIFNVPSEVVKSAIVLEKCVNIDLLIELNAGLTMGFGFFSLSSNQVLSLFEPLCNKDQFIFIGSYAYQKCNEQYKIARDYLTCFRFDDMKSITSNNLHELGYEIELSNLTSYSWSCKEIDITVFNTKKENSEILIEKGGIKLHFVHGNVLSMKGELDIMLLYFRNIFMYRQFNKAIISALDFRGKYIKGDAVELYYPGKSVQDEYDFSIAAHLATFSDTYQAKKIGFIPLKGFDYVQYINLISQNKGQITDMYFFYYDNKDLDNIYKVKEIATI